MLLICFLLIVIRNIFNYLLTKIIFLLKNKNIIYICNIYFIEQNKKFLKIFHLGLLSFRGILIKIIIYVCIYI